MHNSLILFTLLSAATLAAAQESAAPTSRHEFFPSWSPDGSQIVFVSDRDSNWEIYTKNADGSGLARLTHNEARDSNPVWSPSGSHIYFYSDVTGNREVFALRIGESEPVNLTNNPARDGVLAVSPDGSKIAWYSERDGNGEIYTMLVDGSKPVNLTHHAARDRWREVYPALSEGKPGMLGAITARALPAIFRSSSRGRTACATGGLQTQGAEGFWCFAMMSCPRGRFCR